MTRIKRIYTDFQFTSSACIKATLMVLSFGVLSCKREHIISVSITNELSARKTYAGLTGKEYDSIRLANPEMKDPILEKAGLIKHGRLLTEKFKTGNLDLHDNQKKLIKLRYGNVLNDAHRTIYLSNNTSETTISAGSGTAEPLRYAISDLIEGGYPEIITLNSYYIMNSDNYDVTVYEIKTK